MKQIRPASLSQRVLKAMGIFSGVQVAGIFSGLVRTKLVAVWIGVTGVGLFGIFNTAIDLISTVTLLGIGSSAVRDIALARDNPSRMVGTAAVVYRWGRICALGGTLVMLLAASLLSNRIFGEGAYAGDFRILAAAIFFMGLSATEQAVLQGMGEYHRLARASILGIATGVAGSAPLFYFWGEQSIPWAIVLCAVCVYTTLRLERPRFSRPLPSPSWHETWEKGRTFVTLGFFIMFSMAMSYAATFIFLAWLTRTGGEEASGQFQAGFTLFNRYAGLIFTAMAVEFYPRLATTVGSRRRMSIFTAHEITLVLWLLMPIVIIFAACAPLIVRVLYSEAFLCIVPFITVGVIGTIFRALSWAMGFSIIAKGKGHILIMTECLSALLFVGINIVAWKLGGLDALGYGYIIWYLIYLLVIAAIYFGVFRLRLRRGPRLLTPLVTGLAIVAVVCSRVGGIWAWVNLPLALGAVMMAWHQIKQWICRKRLK